MSQEQTGFQSCLASFAQGRHRTQPGSGKLRQSEFRLNRAEVLAGTGNWEIDLSTKRVTASDGAKRIYGVGKEELTLDDIQKYPLSGYRSSLDAELNALVRDGALYDIEFKIKRANDDQVVAIHSIAHYDPE